MLRTVRHFAQIRNVNPQIHNCAPHTYILIRIQDCEKKTQFLFLETVYFLARLNLFLFNVIVGSFSTSNPLELRNHYIRPKKLLTAISILRKPTVSPFGAIFQKRLHCKARGRQIVPRAQFGGAISEIRPMYWDISFVTKPTYQCIGVLDDDIYF